MNQSPEKTVDGKGNSQMDPQREIKSEEPLEFLDTGVRLAGTLDEEATLDLPGDVMEVKEEPVETPTVEQNIPKVPKFSIFDTVDEGHEATPEQLHLHDVIDAMGSLNMDQFLQAEEASAMDAPWAHTVNYDRDS